MDTCSAVREGLLYQADSTDEESKETMSGGKYVPPDIIKPTVNRDPDPTSNNNSYSSSRHKESKSGNDDEVEADALLPSPPTPMKKMISDPTTNVEKLTAWTTIMTVHSAPQSPCDPTTLGDGTPDDPTKLGDGT